MRQTSRPWRVVSDDGDRNFGDNDNGDYDGDDDSDNDDYDGDDDVLDAAADVRD